MHRILMQAYVKNSKEAVDKYIEAFNGKLGFNVMNEDGGYYHSEIDIEGNILAVAETKDEKDTGTTMQFCLNYDKGEENKVIHAYEVLKEGGKILFPLGPNDFSSLCADFIDKYGIRWCLFI